MVTWPTRSSPGVRWYVVEQDHPQDPLNEVRRGYDNFARLARE